MAILISAAVAPCLSVPARAQADAGAALPLVAIGEVEERSSASTLWVPGTLLSRHDAQLAAEVAGRLDQVGEVGDQLAAGDVVARLDDAALQLELRAERAEVRRLEARLDYLTIQLERTRRLADQQITARGVLDELEAERAMAGHELEAARIELERTGHLVERSTLRAPFTGLLVERLAPPGSYVTVGEAVARLVDIQRVEVQAQAPLRIAGFIRRGSAVDVRGDGTMHQGRVRAVVPVGDQRSRSFEIRVTLDASPWPVGTALEVRLPSSDPSTAPGALAVPRDALLLRQDATWVWVLERDGDQGVVRRVDVVAGDGAGDLLVVRSSGLKPGDAVVVRGGETLSPGQRVQIIEK